MEKLHFEIIINAPTERVWDKMLTKGSYEQWTSAFAPTSTFVGDWTKGSKMKFTDGTDAGMYSEIADNIPNKFISIKHLGELKPGGEMSNTALWENAFENYTFTVVDGKTKLEVDMLGVPTEMKAMFEDMWPNGLKKLKEISEQGNKEMKDCDFKCESCFMPLGKNLEDAGTETDGTKSTKYCKYCYQNGELMYKGDLDGFQKIAYEQMLKDGMWKPKAWFFTKMVAYAPRWKK